MEGEPLAAEVGLDAAFFAGRVADLVAGFGQSGVRGEENCEEYEGRRLHFLLRGFFGVVFLGALFFLEGLAAWLEGPGVATAASSRPCVAAGDCFGCGSTAMFVGLAGFGWAAAAGAAGLPLSALVRAAM
jgi:hypothetical protein